MARDLPESLVHFPLPDSPVSLRTARQPSDNLPFTETAPVGPVPLSVSDNVRNTEEQASHEAREIYRTDCGLVAVK